MRAVKGIYVNERAIGREWKYRSTSTIYVNGLNIGSRKYQIMRTEIPSPGVPQ